MVSWDRKRGKERGQFFNTLKWLKFARMLELEKIAQSSFSRKTTASGISERHSTNVSKSTQIKSVQLLWLSPLFSQLVLDVWTLDSGLLVQSDEAEKQPHANRVRI